MSLFHVVGVLGWASGTVPWYIGNRYSVFWFWRYLCCFCFTSFSCFFFSFVLNVHSRFHFLRRLDLTCLISAFFLYLLPRWWSCSPFSWVSQPQVVLCCRWWFHPTKYINLCALLFDVHVPGPGCPLFPTLPGCTCVSQKAVCHHILPLLWT